MMHTSQNASANPVKGQVPPNDNPNQKQDMLESKPRPFSYGQRQAIMILVGEKMGLNPCLVQQAQQCLKGFDSHPMTGAAMEREACAMNDRLRHDPALIAKANATAEELMVQHGFLPPKTVAATSPNKT